MEMGHYEQKYLIEKTTYLKLLLQQNELGYTQGVGISYKVDFDTFEELIQKIFKGKKKVAEKKLENQEDPNSFYKNES